MSDISDGELYEKIFNKELPAHDDAKEDANFLYGEDEEPDLILTLDRNLRGRSKIEKYRGRNGHQ